MAYERSIAVWTVAIAALWVASLGQAAVGQNATPASPPAAIPSAPAPSNADSVTGGRLHGVIKSGNIPLPGVTVTAQNTLTGKRYSTTTDITGTWSMTIPQNGRYVIRTEFAAFAQASAEALLNSAGHDRTVNFSLVLASRAVQQDQQEAGADGQDSGQPGSRQDIRQLAGNAPENLSLSSTLSAGTETGGSATGVSGAELPSIAANSDFGDESVAISGQAGQVSPLAGVDMDQLRAQFQQYREQNGGQAPGAGGLFGGFGGGGFGRGGFGGGGFGGRGGGRGNFRGFDPSQPHGAVFWVGSNGAINALPFSLDGQQQVQPPNGSNRFGITFMSEPYIPHLTKPSGKDVVFLTLSGTRQSTPEDEYANVPTDEEKAGNFSAMGLPAIYNPATGLQFTNNTIPSTGSPGQSISSQAATLLALYPEPNLSPSGTLNYNYHLLTTEQSNSTQAGLRYNRSIGPNASLPMGRGGFGGFRRNQNQGLRQSINFNYNYSHSASDIVNFIPVLGGKSQTDSYSLQAGYTVSYHRITSIFNATWNRSNAQTINFFTNTANNVGQDIYGVTVPNDIPLNYGIPSIQMNQFNGLSEQQPSFALSQTIAESEVLSWIHGKHNMRFGVDYRRVHRDFLAGSDATGSFTFTGLFTEDSSGDADTGSSLADFLLGYPQSTSLNSSVAKSYLRDNAMDAYAMDDWRVKPSLTLNYGVRWEYYAPYIEKYGHLAEVLTNPSGGFTTLAEAQAGSNGLPASLVFPDHRAFRPSVGLAWRVPKIKQTVVRSGFGMNYTVGEYATFATTMAHQPPFTTEETNEEAVSGSPSSACAQTSTCFTLANGFPAAQTLGNIALDAHFPLPYVMAWNLDIQKTLPWGVVVNIGYNGVRSNHQSTVLAPRPLPNSPLTDPSDVCLNGVCQPLQFTYEEAQSFSKFNAGTVRVNKRLTRGFAVGANYQYSHSIDDAGALGSAGGVGVQDWQNVLGELGNSSLDVRHTVSGTYLYELPFGSDKFWVTTGVASHILEGFSISGTYQFATGTWLSPSFASSVATTLCGTGGAMRPNLTGEPIYAGGGGLHQWFNPSAYEAPTSTPGYCNYFGNAPRNSIEGPGTVTNNMALSKTAQLGDTRSLELRATLTNAFNTVQYKGVGATVNLPTFGQVTSVGQMREFQFTARYRF